jgi:hypothetical protein
MTTDYKALQEQAIANARHQSTHGPAFNKGECLYRCRLAFGIKVAVHDATLSWRESRTQHTKTAIKDIPRGVPVYWTGGSEGNGHIAISVGNGRCLSTDIHRRGFFDEVPITDINRLWGNGLRFVGWSETLNGVRVWEEPAPEPRKPPTPAPVDPKKVPQATHYEEFVLGVRALWAAHGQHIQKKYKARRHAAEMALEDVNAGPPIRKGVKK